jgi:hypothetical protein
VTVRDAIDALLGDPADRVLARSIFGTDDPVAIATNIEAYTGRFGPVTTCHLFTQSVGAVFDLEIETRAVFDLEIETRRIVLKVHGHGSRWGAVSSPDALAAVSHVQRELARSGFPCADVIDGPTPFMNGSIVAMTHITGPLHDPHTPAMRTAMAALLHESMTRTSRYRDHPHLPAWSLPRDEIFPAPHNALFDFHVAGGEWIDAVAKDARARMRDDNVIAVHTDLSAANVRFDGARIVCVYDMDSIALTGEMRILANTVVHFTYTGDAWTWPTSEEIAAFIDDYAIARGAKLTIAERAQLEACMTYSLAYTARCEHALDPDGRALEGSCRAKLREGGPKP